MIKLVTCSEMILLPIQWKLEVKYWTTMSVMIFRCIQTASSQPVLEMKEVNLAVEMFPEEAAASVPEVQT